jgi:hypothetical protein
MSRKSISQTEKLFLSGVDEARVAFKESMKVDSAGCHIWVGPFSESGRGRRALTPRFNFRGTVTSARQAAWLFAGKILPPGRNLKNTCGNRSCVNPIHLSFGLIHHRRELGRQRQSEPLSIPLVPPSAAAHRRPESVALRAIVDALDQLSEDQARQVLRGVASLYEVAP